MNEKNTDTTCENVTEVCELCRKEKLAEFEILQQSLDEKKKAADGYYDQLLRLKAEFENFRNRTEKEKQTHRLWGKEEILLKQINLYDVLEQAYNSIKLNASPEVIQKGLELIISEFGKMLAGEGVTEIDCADKKFDPNFHEAIDYVENEQEEGTISGVLMKGYIFNGRVVRPARVRVAKGNAAKI